MAGQDAKLGFDVQWRNDLRRLARRHEYRTAVIDAVSTSSAPSAG
ncbi:hypothetical protein OG342_01585 [Streptomyces bobili]|nr:hypothetical protein [Streptomyces bobili]MCX5521576.1 hypothetical protein [Streptomyces bobili]